MKDIKKGRGEKKYIFRKFTIYVPWRATIILPTRHGLSDFDNIERAEGANIGIQNTNFLDMCIS
jgi:hypothetical protein